MRRLTVTLLLLVIAISAQPAAAVTPDEAAGALDGGVYVASDAETVDAGRLRELVADAGADGLELRVVVLGASDAGVDTVAFAETVSDLAGGTVLVFSPAEYGVASDELSQPDLDDALDEAAAALGGPDVAGGVAAFIDAAQPTSFNWPLLIGGAVLVLVVVGVSGRIIERRATAGRRARALGRKWRELGARADALADPILELETKVDLAGREDVAARYGSAANHFAEVQRRLDGPPDATVVDELDGQLTALEGTFAEVRRAVGAS